MTAYSDLQAQVSGLLNRRDATTAQVQAWIQLSIQRIQRELRVPAMEKVVLVTIPSNTDGTITVPSDLLELIDIINPWGVRLVKKDITEVLQAAKTTGNSLIYYRQGGKYLIGEAAQANDVFTLIYYAELAPLVSPTDTNIVVSIAPDLIVYGALGYAGDFYVDKRTATWEQRYGQIIEDLQAMADADENSGGATVSAPTYWPDDGVAYGYP